MVFAVTQVVRPFVGRMAIRQYIPRRAVQVRRQHRAASGHKKGFWRILRPEDQKKLKSTLTQRHSPAILPEDFLKFNRVRDIETLFRGFVIAKTAIDGTAFFQSLTGL
jgi:hypothetical protein